MDHMSKDLKKLIEDLKERENILLLVHYYQRMEIQDIADRVGDSLKLSLEAMNTKAKKIVFCGVYFMAEQAAVLNPETPVYIPDETAGCPLADMLSIDDILRARKKYPRAPVVLYVNSRAIHKAYADYIVTSANAADVIGELPYDVIIFGPDKNLADHVAEKTGKNIIPVPPNGHCYVHVLFDDEDVKRFKEKGFKIVVHPECEKCVRKQADFIGSTKQMYDYIRGCGSKKIAIGTELGFVERVMRDFPDKEIYPLNESAICKDMKKITLEKVYECITKSIYRVLVPHDVAKKIRQALKRTFELLGVT